MSKLIKTKRNSGMALGVILCLTACFGIWITSISWSMMNSRSSYQKMLKNRKAYFMARGGMEHLMLKLKVMQRHSPQSMRVLENADEKEKKMLYNAFLEDIAVPPDVSFSGNIAKYRVTDFNLESVDLEHSRLTVNVGVTGIYEGQENKISRLMRISR
ncbi:MAG: hypothetical protein PHF08_00525 [Candidatus Riflebacteria bacterium]|nr:hypothetical protein [Candidatus Riflebacteria bacterium]MDD2623398.1 hypothetical protein [Candidatus Riflebacteria bacterium]MDD3375912.1 hypothetical protein [Candidatus Riflebacteria bacterium]NLV94692.1 hypothetical protein [Candidatus Riflebacteria bacterium]